MRKIIFVLIATVFIFVFSLTAVTAYGETKAVLDIDAKSCYLIDAESGREMYGFNQNERYPIASMVKIMTMNLAFEAIAQGELSLDETITISENSSGMGGSQMFLDTGETYPVSDLLKGIIVASANDACVAIAERLEGSQEAFVEKMNKKAQALNMNDTRFANCTGLPAPGAYSSAHDVAIMTRQLVKYKDYFTFSKIWLEDFKHPDGRTTVLTNTNKLVRFYSSCDGGKTGYTSEAKFCLSATAVKNDMRVISVIIGAPDSKSRFADSRKLLDYAFANYKNEIIYKAGEEAGQVTVSNGKERTIAFAPSENISELLKRGEEGNLEVKFELYDIKAPIDVNQKVGEAYAVKDGQIVATVDLIALTGTKKANIGDLYERILGNWGV